jgi:hypothetical protein
MDLMKRFNEYFDKIEESLDNPSQINWIISNNSYIGEFIIDNVEYRIEYVKQIGNNWSYSFSYFDIDKDTWSYNISHKGSGGFVVLSTVKSGLYYLHDKTNPNSIIFSAIDSSDTRKRLYQSFCEEFCKNNNWSFSNRGSDEKRLFVMFNNNIIDSDKEEVFLSVQKVVELSK